MNMSDDDKPDPLKIDILQMELDQKLPYWLDPSQRYPDKAEEIRQRHRDKAKRKPKPK